MNDGFKNNIKNSFIFMFTKIGFFLAAIFLNFFLALLFYYSVIWILLFGISIYAYIFVLINKNTLDKLIYCVEQGKNEN